MKMLKYIAISCFILFFMLVFSSKVKKEFEAEYLQMNYVLKNKIEKAYEVPFNEKVIKRIYVDVLAFTGRKWINNSIKLRDGMVDFNDGINNEKLALEGAARVIELKKYLDKVNTPLIFVRAPSKVKNISVLPYAGLPYYTIENANASLDKMVDNGVEVLDLRKVFEKHNISYINAFFKSDHHWTAETALWSTSIVAKELNENPLFNFDLDRVKLSLENFMCETNYDCFTGSIAIRTSLSFVGGKDDVRFLFPKYPIRFIVYDYNEKILFENTNFNDTFLTSKVDSYGKLNRLDNIKIKNKYSKNKNRILLLTDSFGMPVAPYLSCVVDEVDFVILSNPIVENMIKNNKYDAVIILVSDYTVGINSGRLIFGEFEDWT